MLDTILNITSFRVALGLVKQKYNTDIPIYSHYAQGDDVVFAVRSIMRIPDLIAVYNQLGYEIHPEKTFLSRRRSEFLRRSYEDVGVVGYNTRTLVSIRFRNPILSLPLVKAERFYSRLVLWHLAVLRGNTPSIIAEMMLEDGEQMGVPRELGADFALTPNCVGGCGVDPDSLFGRAFARYSSGRWIVPRVKKEKKKIVTDMGIWRRRLEAADVHLTSDSGEKLREALALSWGIPPSRLYGKVEVVWSQVQKVRATPFSAGETLPPAHRLWNLDGIPRMVRGLVQRQAVRDGSWSKYVQQDAIPELKRFQRRVSTSVFELYMLSEIKAPSPITDSVGLRYGVSKKKRLEEMVTAGVNRVNMGLLKLAGMLYHCELKMREELKTMSIYGVWGV